MAKAKTLCMIVATVITLGLGECGGESFKTYNAPQPAAQVCVERERIKSAEQLEQYLMEGRTDFSNADLYGLDLSGIDFRKYHDLYGALDFSNADMRGINLRGAYLAGADLSGANLGPLEVRE